jgi:hypothetical protein
VLTATVADPAGSAARSRYEALYRSVLPLYEQGRYAEALDRVDAAGDAFGLWSSDVAHIRACLQALLGRPEEALATYQAGLARGGWWHENMLQNDPDLASLQRLPGFEDVVRESHARCLAASCAAPPTPPLLLRPDGEPVGVLAVLHGGNGSGPPAVGPLSSGRCRPIPCRSRR